MFENLTGKARVWLRERKERAEEKRARQALESEHGHGRFFLLHVPAAATICAAVTEWYWAILFCIEATGSIDWNYETAFGTEQAAASVWNFAFATHWPVFLGLVAATVPIVMLSMVWLPVQFAMRGTGRWRRGTVIVVGVLANILVIISGTVVMNHNRQEQVRADLVVEQQAQANRGAIQAQIDAVNEDLARLTDRRINNEYAATAANVGAESYRAQYMSAEALARSPEARRDIIVRALGAAERADALRAERTGLFQQLAQAPTEAAVAANVEDTVGQELNTFAQVVEVWRPPFVAVICTLIGIFGAWWVLALMQGLNPRDVMRSGWADESHRIPDMRDQAKPAAQPMEPMREGVFDAETGEELVPVKATWRRKPRKKGEREKVDFAPDPLPDETGVETDGGGRTASAAPPIGGDAQERKNEQQRDTEDEDHRIQDIRVAHAEPAPGEDRPEYDGHNGGGDASVDDVLKQPEPSEPLDLPELTEEEYAALDESPVDQPAEQSADADAGDDQPANETDAEIEPIHHEPRTEPETDERRMIAAE